MRSVAAFLAHTHSIIIYLFRRSMRAFSQNIDSMCVWAQAISFVFLASMLFLSFYRQVTVRSCTQIFTHFHFVNRKKKKYDIVMFKTS